MNCASDNVELAAFIHLLFKNYSRLNVRHYRTLLFLEQ